MLTYMPYTDFHLDYTIIFTICGPMIDWIPNTQLVSKTECGRVAVKINVQFLFRPIKGDQRLAKNWAEKW